MYCVIYIALLVGRRDFYHFWGRTGSINHITARIYLRFLCGATGKEQLLLLLSVRCRVTRIQYFTFNPDFIAQLQTFNPIITTSNPDEANAKLPCAFYCVNWNHWQFHFEFFFSLLIEINSHKSAIITMNLQMSSRNRTRWKDQEVEHAPKLLNLS